MSKVSSSSYFSSKYILHSSTYPNCFIIFLVWWSITYGCCHHNGSVVKTDSFVACAFSPSSLSSGRMMKSRTMTQTVVLPLEHHFPKKISKRILLFSLSSDKEEKKERLLTMAAKVEHGNNIISNTSSSITTTTSKSHFHTSLSLLTALSLVGLVDTLYLTWVKLNINNNSGQSLLFCDNTDSSCHSVLESSYSTIHIGTDIHIPLSLLGVISYSLTSMTSFVFLSSSSTYLMPTALLIQTTAMATFSTFYMYILFFILHQSCPYCILSAVVSITMASICWYTTISQQQHQESSSISTTTLDHTDSNTDISIQMIYNIQDEKEEDATIPTSSPSSSSSSSILRIPTNIIYGITSLLTTTLVAY